MQTLLHLRKNLEKTMYNERSWRHHANLTSLKKKLFTMKVKVRLLHRTSCIRRV